MDHELTPMGFTREPPPEINRIQIAGHLGPDPNANMVMGPKARILTIFMARVFIKAWNKVPVIQRPKMRTGFLQVEKIRR